MEEFGASGLGKGVEAFLELELEDVRIHGEEATSWGRRAGGMYVSRTSPGSRVRGRSLTLQDRLGSLQGGSPVPEVPGVQFVKESCVAEYTRMVRPNPPTTSRIRVEVVDRDIPDSHVREVNPALRELLAEPTP